MYMCIHSDGVSSFAGDLLLLTVASPTALTIRVTAILCVIIFIYILINQV